ncbi:hypothetical protein LV92_03606 [Arenibacter echinorum]|uniref:Uncharacterized protein n=1 Tax=Arenibacter echinorum TaxID=440515 RepID=A0A327QXB3_9FLAO|nr:hypothetical protein LV92_03606 [Arenibacter echinorum]
MDQTPKRNYVPKTYLGCYNTKYKPTKIYNLNLRKGNFPKFNQTIFISAQILEIKCHQAVPPYVVRVTDNDDILGLVYNK